MILEGHSGKTRPKIDGVMSHIRWGDFEMSVNVLFAKIIFKYDKSADVMVWNGVGRVKEHWRTWQRW